jgi:hypothetical protein
MNGQSTYDYKLLKGSWGIRIKLTADVSPHGDGDGEAHSVGHGVWLGYRLEGSPLGAAEKQALARGLGLVSAEISAAVDVQQVDVVIRSARFAETDYQVDGLTAAVMGWATERFGLSGRLPTAVFDRSENRYIYDWG